MLCNHYPFTLPPLPYAFDALSPYLDEEILEVHHNKHFKGYIDKLNQTLANCRALQKIPLYSLLKNTGKLSPDVQTSVLHNGGGVYNHNLYFEILSPPLQSRPPRGRLADAISRDFGSFEAFKEQFTACTQKVFGSGWTFLVKDSGGALKIFNTPNQITPLPYGLCPIILFDLWEHAYYLQYQNRRNEYVQNLWNIINWEKAEECYNKAF